MTRKTAIRIFSYTLAGFFAFNLAHAESAPNALAAYTATLKQKYPGVTTITPAQLASMDPPPFLLDVRDPKEFAVSHLPGAFRAEKEAVAQLHQLGVKINDRIVVYCSVGARSLVLAEKLQAAGFRDVRNLQGSIFAWANEGLPLENSDGPTHGVHPFDHTWGRFLNKSRWRWYPQKRYRS